MKAERIERNLMQLDWESRQELLKDLANTEFQVDEMRGFVIDDLYILASPNAIQAIPEREWMGLSEDQYELYLAARFSGMAQDEALEGARNA